MQVQGGEAGVAGLVTSGPFGLERGQRPDVAIQYDFLAAIRAEGKPRNAHGALQTL